MFIMRCPAAISMRCVLLTLLISSTLLHLTAAFTPSLYDVEWHEPSDLETESMPLGNGDLAMQTWVERSTGDLLYYAQPSSSFEENGQLLKLIRGRLHITPTNNNTFTQPSPTTLSYSSSHSSAAPVSPVQNFRQRLHVLNMSQTITYTLWSAVHVSVTVWVDRYRPVIHFTATTSAPATASLSIEMWRTVPTSMDWWSWGYYCANDTSNVDPDTFVPSGLGLAPQAAGELLWYHRNDHQDTANRTYLHALRLQGLEGIGLEEKDVLRNRTFGGFVTTHDRAGERWSAAVANETVANGTITSLSAAVSTLAPLTDLSFHLYTTTATTDSVDEYLSLFREQVTNLSAVDAESAWSAHEAYWADFHNRSYIEFDIHDVNASASYDLNRDLLLQRLLDGMDGLSPYPIHFNGQAWNIGDNVTGNGPDYRQWGSAFWWQNVREPYYPAVQAGDWDILRSMFSFYQSILPVQEARVQAYYNHSGAYYEETTALYGIMVDGVFGFLCDGTVPIHGNPTIRLHWDGSLELCLLMVDYYRHTADDGFLSDMLLPVCSSIMTFFHQHYPLRDQHNKTVYFPSQALETWWCQNPFNVSDCVTNSVVFVSGLSAVLRGLLSLDSPLIPPASRAQWSEQFDSLPPLPNGPCMGDSSRHCLRPGDIFVNFTGNGENVELYAVWPYRERGLGMADYDSVLNNYWTRMFPGNTGWTQDVVDAAFLGLRDEAAAQVVDRVVNNFDGNNPAKVNEQAAVHTTLHCLVQLLRVCSCGCCVVSPLVCYFLVTAVFCYQGWKFPVFAGPMQDSTPAVDHYANLRTAVTAMLVQEVNSGLFSLTALQQQQQQHQTSTTHPPMHIFNTTRLAQHDAVQPATVWSGSVLLLFAAVPAAWDFDIKLHVSGPATVEATCTNNTLSRLVVTPASRLSDVVVLGCLGASPLLVVVEEVGVRGATVSVVSD